MNSDPNLLVGEESTADAAISLLIDWARRGEIDPWDVDVIEVIDRFLANFNQFHHHQETEVNLPESGQAFLWASMLVSLKADTLEAVAQQPQETDPQESEEEVPLSKESTSEDQQRQALPQGLEHRIRRRGSAPPAKKRRVTLSELITQIKDIAQTIDEPSRSCYSQQRSRRQGKRETAKMISHLAHNENLTELASELEQFWRKVQSNFQDWWRLEELVTWWQQQKEQQGEQNHQYQSNRVGIFWALLLLSAQSKVELSQQEFYQDVKLRFLPDERKEQQNEPS